MNVDEKAKFAMSTITPMAHATFPVVCSVVDATSDVPRLVGSGVRLRVASARVLLTAAHVVDKARDNDGAIVVSATRGEPPRRIAAPTIHRDDVHDIAAIVLPDDYPEAGVGFWNVERSDDDREHLSTDFLFVHGFPGALSGFSALLDGLFNKSLSYGVMERDEDLRGDLTEDQFALDFDPHNFRDTDGKPIEWLDPHGLSGSAVWRVGARGRAANDWRPDLSLLVGVVTTWRPDDKMLVGVRWSAVQSLLVRSM
jgi:hypothetical protein